MWGCGSYTVITLGLVQCGITDFQVALFAAACFSDEVNKFSFVDMEVYIGEYQMFVVLKNIGLFYFDDILFHVQISSLMIFPKGSSRTTSIMYAAFSVNPHFSSARSWRSTRK